MTAHAGRPGRRDAKGPGRRRRAGLPGAALLALCAGLCAGLGGCKVGPDYRRPPAIASVQFKELAGWKIAQPGDTIGRGPWWSVYGDPLLDGLERQVVVSNQTLRAQEAAFRQSVAIVNEARANLFPTVGIGTSVQRSGGGGGSGGTRAGGGTTAATTLGGAGGATGITGTGTSTGVGTGGTTLVSGGSSGGASRTGYSLQGTVDWELDLWGRIRRNVESNVAAAQASAADVANALLSAQAQLAIDYFELRAADALTALLTTTVRDYERSLQITENQYRAGIVARGDVITAQTQVEAARSQLIAAGVQRASLEHAIAVLIGRPPAALTIAPGTLTPRVPVVPPGLPSALLERRPDIAAAERQMAQENALIGEAVAAFYPTVTLSALGGLTGSSLGGLFSVANNVWSLGASASETLFAGGARTAAVQAARAAYDQAVANYRQTALTAFEQVEDELSTLRILEQQSAVQQATVDLARRAVQITLNQYRAGTAAYTAVVTEQAIALSAEETLLTIQQNRLVASVTLIEAIGGGWTTAQIPSSGALQSFNPLLP